MRFKEYDIWINLIVFGFVFLTLEPGIILLYFIILLFNNYYGKYFQESLLVYCYALIFLYPNIADSMTYYLNSQVVILAMTSIVAFYIVRPWKMTTILTGKTFNVLIKSWLFWGIITYCILLFTYYVNVIEGINLMDYFGYPPPHTSNIQVFIYAIPGALIVYIPMISINNVSSFRTLWKVLLVFMVINIIFSLINYNYNIQFFKTSYSNVFSYYHRAYSFSNFDPIGFGRIMLFPLLLLLSYFMYGRKRKNNMIYYVIFILTVLVLLLTWSRTVWIIAIVSIVIVLLFSVKFTKILHIIPIILIAVLAIYYSNPVETIESSTRLSNPEASWEGRLYKHAIAYRFIEKNPLFGAFPGQMSYLSKTIGNETNASAHSLYLQSGVDYGVPGLLIIVAVLIYSIKLGTSLYRRYKSVLNTYEYTYVKVFLVSSIVYSVAMAISGIAESVEPHFVFLNFGIIVAVKKILVSEELSSSGSHIPLGSNV